ncbi:MAG: stage II sporulation protein M [Candidatus Aenigmarchaeota archaeon]|nr:stage II sporulation protein M [Candidatus Aenigmarchaeota archaeon]
MLESLIKYNEIKKNPWLMMFWAILISSVGVLFSIQLAYTISLSGSTVNLAGVFAVMFTIIPSVYFLTNYIKREELQDEKDVEAHYEKGILQRHYMDILVFGFYFTGLTVSFAFWGFMLPADTFQVQTMKVQDIRSTSGGFMDMAEGNMMTGEALSGDYFASFERVFWNNLQVTAFSFVFSILFGAGAIFIIVWNASILGVFIGRLSETIIHIPVQSIPFLPHGIPEIGGYLVAGLAGGIISAAVIRGHNRKILTGVSKDAGKLMAIALLFIFLGALIETMDFLTRLVAIFVFYSIFIYMITVALTPLRKQR